MLKHVKVFILFVVPLISSSVFSQTYTKQETIDLYKKYYQSSELTSIPWKGDIEKCICGVLPDSIYKKAEDRINFFRMMTGLPVVKNEVLMNTDAQEGAFMMKANNQLSHTPDTTWKCYTQSGYNGAHSSCLGISDFQFYPISAFITGFVQDRGKSNYYVGHRRWLLYSKLTKFGYGATTTSEAVMTVGGYDNYEKKLPEYVAYPWNGYVPHQLIFSKWSFSIPAKKSVDFSGTEVTMTDGSNVNMELEVLENHKFLDPTIVWIPAALPGDEDYKHTSLSKFIDGNYLNRKIHVTIKNVVVDGEIKNYDYYVEPIEIK